ncbi:MAG: glutamate synthase [Thermodesulfovibrionales bacterium]|nr:glutamate synthase [Thermodesulfovibrionales bacterium]
MCRLAAITSSKYFSPMENILALETMKEGHDGSGLGLTLKDLGGEFREFKEYPILSCICSRKGREVLDAYMDEIGFKLLHRWKPKIKPVKGIVARDYYFAGVYEYPDEWKDRTFKEKEELLLNTRIALRKMGEKDESIFAFSFYPDVITLKEVGDPLEIGEFFGLDKDILKAKIIFAQGRQNTNYQIYLYACHPFFIQGYCTMTNGENTAFVPIREFLMSRGLKGYIGYNSDSEVFAHILHYCQRQLEFPLFYYKDIITPLKNGEIEGRKDKEALILIKQALRPLCIDGPNMVIGFTPDGTCFMVQDSKKLRPGVVGGVNGKYALMSELCGLDKVIPNRDRSKDIFPMKYDMVIVSPEAKEVKVWNQLQG